MTASDPALKNLFLEEIQRHVDSLLQMPRAWGQGQIDLTASRVFHAMRGAAGMMGLSDAAGLMGEVELALRVGRLLRTEVFQEIDRALRSAGFAIPGFSELRVGTSSFPPAAPSSLPPTPSTGTSGERHMLDPEVLTFFLTEARTRVETLTDVIERIRIENPRPGLDEAFRHVHAIKGAAATVGFVSITRASHAIESALATLRTRVVQGGEIHPAEIEMLRTARSRLATILATPTRSGAEADELVESLRASGLVTLRDASPVPGRPTRPTRSTQIAEIIRIPAVAITQLTARVGEVGVMGSRVAEQAEGITTSAHEITHVAAELEHALQRIGPPRPWGAPADALRQISSSAKHLRDLAVSIERDGERVAHAAELLGALSSEGSDTLQRMSACPVQWIFERIIPAAETLARAENKDVVVLREGGEIELPRTIAERLVEPLVQLVRNAVTHGIETPVHRLSRGKSARGTMRLRATLNTDRLVITISDDGAGVDLDSIADRARALGLIAMSEEPDATSLLATMFLPGISSRKTADDAAGRGVGLDLVHREVSQLGGTVTVWSEAEIGTRFEVVVPTRHALMRVLVVRVGTSFLGIPLDRVVRVITSIDAVCENDLSVTSGHSLLGSTIDAKPLPLCVVLRSERGAVGIEVDEVRHVVPIMLRPMPGLLVGLRPWAGSSIDGEGRVMLILDADLVQTQRRAES